MSDAQTVLPCRELNKLAEKNGWAMQCDCECRFARPELNALLDLWQRKAAAAVPRRLDLSMRDLVPFARYITVLERVEQTHGHSYRFRLFGTALALVFGEHTGRLLEERVMPEMLPGWIAFYDRVLEQCRPLRLTTVYRTPNGIYLQGEIFAAPLADETGAVRLVLAATYVDLKDAIYAPQLKDGSLPLSC
jgi:hypothetical protein